MTSLSSSELFPVRVVYVDEPDVEDEVCESMSELGMELEFYDEFSRFRVFAHAADGSVLRIIADALEVVFCRQVEQPVGPEDLTLSRCRTPEARTGVAEVCQGEVHRVVWDDGEVEPVRPLSDVSSVQLVDGDGGSLKSFFEKWIRGRG